jgi:hypothetical protein
MKHRRTKITLVVVAVILLLLAFAVYLRKKAPPEAARLLPESDGIVYLNLRPLRAATHFDQRPVKHDPDYQKFIDATGIEFERDLDEVAFALHRMPNPSGANGPVAFSEVFVGHFDGRKLTQYLNGVATSQESYAGHTIYTIPSEGRSVRVALVGYDIIAVSNTPTAEQIHSMLDRYRSAALPFSGSSLLTDHYEEVPLLSLAWGIGQIGLPFGDSGNVNILGVRLPVTFDSTFIASLRWTGALRLRLEEIAPTEEAAAASAESVQTLVSLLRSAQPMLGPNAIDWKPLLDSVKIEHRKDRAVLNATLPLALLEKLLTPQSLQPSLPAPVTSEK